MTAQASPEQAVIDKSRFLATASHDLRRPLHALGLFHHTLRVKSETASNHELFESLDMSMAALNAMFDSLLDVSRLDANVVANLSISVRDTGQGIPEDERKNVFHEFYQLQDNSRSRIAGVGLPGCLRGEC